MAPILFTAAAFAQGTGTIHGIVTDPSGLAIPGARVLATLVNRGTTRSIDANAEGAYVLPLLPAGIYTISVEGQGFKRFTREGINLSTSENVRVDVQLEVGAVAESINVSGEIPLIDTRSSTTGALIDSRRVLDLPINGRNVASLGLLLPGASQVFAPQTFSAWEGGALVSMSGARGNENLFLFDGAPFNSVFRNRGLTFPPPDALQEVKVLTSGFSAEYGRNAGGIFNVVTRSGSNELHGSAWEFLRNQDLNARNFFAPSPVPQLIQNQYGATAGGPIRKDKLFLFASYEALRVRPAALQSASFPLTTAERSGDFSASGAPVRDPLTGQPFPGNRIPASLLDPTAHNLLSPQVMPLPNRPNGQLVTTSPNPQDNDTLLIRADWNRGRHTIFGHYNYNLAHSKGSAGDVPGYFPLSNRAKGSSITAEDTTTIRPTLINQIRLSYSRQFYLAEELNRTHLSDFGADFPRLGGPVMPPNIGISGRINLGAGLGDFYEPEEIYQFKDVLDWTKDNHSVKAGFELVKTRFVLRTNFTSNGSFSFTGAFTGSAAADFLVGRPASVLVRTPYEQPGLRTSTYYFVQDDWKIHPRLTLNIGLRYELPIPQVHPHDLQGSLHPGEQSRIFPSAPVGMVYAGDPGVPRGLVQTPLTNFAPRFGFAWNPFRNGRTSVRGAYGIFYETVNGDAAVTDQMQPFTYTLTVPSPFSLSDPLRGQASLPVGIDVKNPLFVGVQELFYLDPSLRTPYLQHFNFNVQHQLAGSLAVQVGYVGKLGRKLLMGISPNPAVYAPGATLANINSRRILPGYGNNSEITSQGTSSYHAMQAEIDKRFSRGFSFQGAYTFSRSIDLASAVALGPAVPNVFDFRTQRGLSDFHAKHIASFSWIWDIPTPGRNTAILRVLARGWQLNGLVTLRSGLPFNVLTGQDVALSGTPNQRPDVIGDPGLPGDRSRGEKIQAWFSRNAFASPRPGQYGNTGRNALLGPASATTNVGCFRDIAIPGFERLKLQFRSEFFNLFNSVNLGTPLSTLTSGSRMGLITSADPARQIQFALKARF